MYNSYIMVNFFMSTQGRRRVPTANIQRIDNSKKAEEEAAAKKKAEEEAAAKKKAEEEAAAKKKAEEEAAAAKKSEESDEHIKLEPVA